MIKTGVPPDKDNTYVSICRRLPIARPDLARRPLRSRARGNMHALGKLPKREALHLAIPRGLGLRRGLRAHIARMGVRATIHATAATRRRRLPRPQPSLSPSCWWR